MNFQSSMMKNKAEKYENWPWSREQNYAWELCQIANFHNQAAFLSLHPSTYWPLSPLVVTTIDGVHALEPHLLIELSNEHLCLSVDHLIPDAIGVSSTIINILAPVELLEVNRGCMPARTGFRTWRGRAVAGPRHGRREPTWFLGVFYRRGRDHLWLGHLINMRLALRFPIGGYIHVTGFQFLRPEKNKWCCSEEVHWTALLFLISRLCRSRLDVVGDGILIPVNVEDDDGVWFCFHFRSRLKIRTLLFTMTVV